MAEERLSEVEKKHTMLELELKEIKQRHQSDFNKKDVVIANVTVYCELISLNFININYFFLD